MQTGTNRYPVGVRVGTDHKIYVANGDVYTLDDKYVGTIESPATLNRLNHATKNTKQVVDDIVQDRFNIKIRTE